MNAAFFKQKEEGLKRARFDCSGHFRQQNEAGLRASYMVSLRIAQEKKPHNIAEKLIVPCCKDIIRCVIGCDAEQKVTSVPLSNDTVHRRIVDMSEDVKQQVIAELKEASLGKFAIQLDESTDVAACAQLLVFVRYVTGQDFKEEFLFCHTLNTTTRGEDIFNEVSLFFEKEGLSWNNVCACTTDGAPAMLGRRSGFRGRVNQVNPETKHLHCMLHRYALASKTLPPDLELVLDDVVHMVNAIKSSAQNTRLFSLLCQEFGSDEEVLLLHTEVRWLSRGNVVSRVESLKEELTEFFKCDNKAKSLEFTKKLSDSQWLQKLAYLSDIFLRLNSFNLSLQGRFATVSDFMDKLRSLTMKLELWEGKVKDGNLSMFEHLGEALDKSQNTGKQDVMQLVQSHLASLRMELQSYFPELSELESKLIRNPFIVNVHLLPDNMQEEFLELVNDSVAKDAFETLSLTKF
ncbi:zinc finger BED domain-containing protein 5-like [Palaemon carinicauda]|uniref:zinc finger BED domain-containing protein 5-like n=1 Tax=Palaemon carinicauda TaxID=392227 RepID=UPI0035B5AA89